MRFAIVALLLVGGAVYYFSDGGVKLGFVETPELPETIEAPNATFLGSEKENPFAQ